MRLKPNRDFEEFARYCIRLARRSDVPGFAEGC